jgi:AcrR family transcriptional regulator
MGLRATKAARTRAQIVDAAVELFLQNGYESTTMEQIAEAAEIGSSTLYRYFSAKDLILLEPFAHDEVLVDAIRDRPADEPLESVLGGAVLAVFDYLERDQPRINAIRTLIDQSPGPRARLWDVLARNRGAFESAIAARLGEPADSAHVKLTAGLTQLTIELVADLWRTSEGTRQLSEIARTVLADEAMAGVVAPRLPG